MPRTTEHIVGEIRQALEDTTPGPWVWTRHDLDSTIQPFYSVIAVDHDGGCGCRRACDLQIDISDADRALIAEAPDLLARAADRIEQLEAQLRAAIPDGHDGDGSGGERNTGAVVVPPEGEPEGEPIR